MSGRKRGRRRQRAATTEKQQLTAFGRWISVQPRGVQTRAMLATGLAYTTVLGAKSRLVTRDVAEALAAFTGGVVLVDEMVKPRPYGRVA